MTDTSTLNIEINLDKAKKDTDRLNRTLDDTTRKGDKAARTIKKTGKEAEKATAGFGLLKTTIAGVFSFQALSGFARVISTFQSLENSLGVVFDSMERGAAVLGDIKELAATTPFSVEALTQSVIKLRAAGIEPTINQLTLFSDTASVSADSLGTLQAITDLFARTTAGGLGLEDLNRLADRGIPVFTIFSEKLGISRLEVSELGKTAEGASILLNALTEGLEERFGGASAQAADLLKTQISNLGDAWDRFLDSIGRSGGLAILGTIITGITASLEFMSNNLDTVAVAVSGLATLAIPSLIKAVNALTLALAANPIGLIVVAVTAAITAVYHFRGVIYDTLVRIWEVTIPNAIDTTILAFTKFDRKLLDIVNSVLRRIQDLGNSLIRQTPDFLKGLLGIDGYEFEFQISTEKFDAQIDFLERRIADRIANFEPPPRPDFLGLDDGSGSGGPGGLSTNTSLTGVKVESDVQGTEQLFGKVQSKLAEQVEAVELSLLTEEEKIFESYARRQFMVEEAFAEGIISQEKQYDLLLQLEAQYQQAITAEAIKGYTDRQKFAAKSTQAQTAQVVGELVNLTAGVAQHNRQMFELNKAAGIAQATINTYEGVTKTLSAYPQPLAGILAAAHLAAGLAQVSAIQGTSFNGGGGTAPSGITGGASAPAGELITPVEQPDEREQQGTVVEINIDGNLYGNADFIDAVVEAVETAQNTDKVFIRAS